jgi:hypothetical protein
MGSHQILAPQRKDLDAAHAASKGVRIPRTFPTFDEAKAFVLRDGGTIILRSEHPLELQGLSGLNMSHVVSPEIVAEHEKEGGLFASFRGFDSSLLEYMMRAWHKDSWFYNVRNYCKHNGLNVDAYLASLTYSYWEYVPGYNLYVVADSSVHGRYRVFAKWPERVENCQTSYDLFEGAQVLSEGCTPTAILSRIEDIFKLYEQVRDVFGKDMCWVVEMQLAGDGDLYFLQRSAGQPFKPAGWSFESDEPSHFLLGPKYGYGEVRGITPEEGITLSFLLDRGTRIKWIRKHNKDYQPAAILSAHMDSRVAEQELLGSVQAYIETYYQGHGDCISDPHSAILPMVRVPLYLCIPKLHERLPTDMAAEAKRLQKAKEEGEPDWYIHPEAMVQMTLHVRSDGREARVNIVSIA